MKEGVKEVKEGRTAKEESEGRKERRMEGRKERDRTGVERS